MAPRVKTRIQGDHIWQRIDYTSNPKQYTVVLQDEDGISGAGSGATFQLAIDAAMDDLFRLYQLMGIEGDPF